MEGKQVVVIGGGSFRMRNMWSDAEKYGIKVILVESDPDHIARHHVHCFIEYNFSDHTSDDIHAVTIISLIHRRGLKADGCLSFYNECTPLAALICERLELKGLSYKSAIIANSKSQTQNLLNMSKKEFGNALDTKEFSSQAVHLKSEMDCDMIPDSFQFPAILKLDNCSGGIGACMVNTKKELKERFQHVTRSLCTDTDFPQIGLSRGNSMTTFEFYSGTEHNVDVILFDGTLVWAFITDSGVVRHPLFIGLTDGTFNVEFIMTADGPKLVEINPRMCGYVFRDWILRLYGIDIMLYTMMIHCGIKPEIPCISTSTIQMGVMVLPSLHGKLLTDDFFKTKLSEMIDSGDVIFLQFLDNLEHVYSFDKPFGNVAVFGSSSTDVKMKLLNVCKALDIDQDDYKVETFIKNF